MSSYTLDLRNSNKEIYSGHLKLGGSNPKGDTINFTNYFMELNSKPFLGIMGEFQYSRYPCRYWEEEILKMKSGGIHIIATYMFWIHHEEDEGIFNWEGCNNVRCFVELCKKHGMYAVLRIGPFVHGECRNGGLPDWLYGCPFEVRSNDESYLYYVKRWYEEIGRQVKGQLFKDGGPIIGIQLENEYMSSWAPWESTITHSKEWVPKGRDGIEHMKILKILAVDSGLDVPIYTCTGWGGAPVIEDEMLPLYGGYAFCPWEVTESNSKHPPTDNFIFVDFHSDEQKNSEFFQNSLKTTRYPYACCEIGGGCSHGINTVLLFRRRVLRQ